MSWKIETLVKEPNPDVISKLEQTAENSFKVTWNVSKVCPGCISQILVSSCPNTYCKVADINTGSSAELSFDMDKEKMKEVWAAVDLQYNLQDAINNFPKNVRWHVYWEEVPPAVLPAPKPPIWLLLLIPIAGLIAYLYFKRK
jgi:hypothetical protein